MLITLVTTECTQKIICYFHIATFWVHSVVTNVISIFPTYKFNFYRFVNLSTEDDRSFCRNMFCKFKSVVVFFKIKTIGLIYTPENTLVSSYE